MINFISDQEFSNSDSAKMIKYEIKRHSLYTPRTLVIGRQQQQAFSNFLEEQLDHPKMWQRYHSFRKCQCCHYRATIGLEPKIRTAEQNVILLPKKKTIVSVCTTNVRS